VPTEKDEKDPKPSQSRGASFQPDASEEEMNHAHLTAGPNTPVGTTPTTLRLKLSLLVLVSAQFVIMLDTSILNVALPSLQAELQLSQTGVAWTVNAYFLAFGGFLLLSGRVADVYGRRRMFMLGAGVFTAASLAAGFAPSEAVLVAARLLQGLGAAMLSPAAMSILMMMFPGTARARAMSAWSAASAAGGAAGVFAGGAITASLDWEWVFFAPLPVTVLALAAAPLLFQETPGQKARRRFDAAGAAAVTAGALSLIYAILSAADHGWLSWPTLGGVLLGALLLTVFKQVEQQALDPIVPLDLFALRSFSVGVVVGLLGGAARVCTFFLVALFLQQVTRFAPQDAGLAMVPTSATVFATSILLLPRLLHRFGPERTVLAGLTALAAGLIWLSRSPASATYGVDILPGLLLAATGVALSFTPTTMVITTNVPAALTGVASGIATASSQIGGAMGISLFSTVVVLASHAASTGGASAEAAVASGYSWSLAASALVALTAAGVTAMLLISKTSAKPTN
jgi:EmrB/QacA subfamily drug resistance transporter